MADKQEQRKAERLEAGKELVMACINAAVVGIEDAPVARAKAKEVVEDLRGVKTMELDVAEKRFKLLQRVEFVVGALALVQIAVFMLRGEPYLVPLVFSTIACLALYVIVAILDSRAKGKRLDIQQQILATKKVKFKNAADDRGIIIEFE